MPDVVIRTTDFQTRPELGALVVEIGARMPGSEVEIDDLHLPPEALNLVIFEATEQTIKATCDGVIVWARNRLRKAYKEGKPKPRPIVFTVWDSNRRVLASLHVSHPDHEPEDLTTGRARKP